ncbi:hypothetical protein [Anaeromyxobacter sp. Fw109-5]|uniref:hypothetical protein n=1 Tax=Anaeromyxobacter sp. (strain Fw109-5) TaxID=404589 RepID=UPI0000ED76C8|nr:hypothetical protein [Anaeromyxobacter sp. Fw109-5]ABS25925.1 conserved hypothetical protein [Anaeromyxobacter sp. Fw109-5]
MRRLFLALLAVSLALACRTPEEKLADRRRDLRDALDRLYEDYGTGDPAREGGRAREADAGDGPDERARGGDEVRPSGGVVGRFVKGLERSHFEESCLAVGRGERPFLLSDRLESFLEDAGNLRGCRDAARIEADIAALEREVQARR